MPTIEESINALLEENDTNTTSKNIASNQMITSKGIVDNTVNVDNNPFELLFKEEIDSVGTDETFDKKKASQTEKAFGMFKSNRKIPSFSNIFTEVDVTGPGIYSKTIEDTKKKIAEPFKAEDGLQILSYNNFKSEEITKEKLLKNNDFLADARAILKNRHNMDDRDLDTPDKIWEAWTERQRYYDMGHEATLALDFDYLLNPDNKFVEHTRTNRYGRLLDIWEKYKGEPMSWRKFQDYAGAGLTSPSNILAFTGPTLLTKLGGVGAKEVGKAGIKAYLKSYIKAATIAGTIDTAVGYAQSSGKEKLRSETLSSIYGKEVPFRQDVVNLETAIQGGSGFLLGGFGALLDTRAVNKSLDLAEAFKTSKKEISVIAKKNTDDFLKTVKKSRKKKVTEKLAALNPELTAMGRKIRQDLTPDPANKNFIAGLPVEFHNNLVASVLKIEDLINPRKGERITSALHRVITEGVELPNGTVKKFQPTEILKILKEHNITTDQFGLVFLSDVSDAGKTLQSMAQLKKTIKGKIDVNRLAKKEVDNFIELIDGLDTSGLSRGLNPDTVSNVFNNSFKKLNFTRNFWQKLDRAKLGGMTVQPQTTLRNNINGLFRIGTDTGYYALNQLMSGKNPLRIIKESGDTFALSKYMFSPADAKVFRKIFSEEFPEEAAYLFREMADVALSTSDDGIITKGTTGQLSYLATKMNVLNTVSDNYFKQGALLTFMRREVNNLPAEKLPVMTAFDKRLLLAQKIQKDFPDLDQAKSFVDSLSPNGLSDALRINNIPDKHNLFSLIQTGKLSEIPPEATKQAIQDTYEFVYQANFKSDGYLNRFNKAVQSGHKNFPFVISSFFPFPKYTANHLKTIYNHLPLINMVKIENLGSRSLKKEGYGRIARLVKTDPVTFKKDMARGMVGTGLYLAALEWRYRQGNTNAWWEIKSDTGKTIDGRPIYGAVAPYMLAADITYRYQTNTLPTTKEGWNEYGKQMAQALIGVTIRRGFGLMFLDKLVSSFDENNSQISRGMTEEFMSTVGQQFMIPTQVVTNFLGFSDKQARNVPETADGKTNVLDIVIANALRGAPDLKNVDVSSGISDEYSFPYLTTNDYTKLEYKSGTGEISINKMFTDIPMYDKQSVDPIEGPRKNQSPLYKLSGFTLMPEKQLFNKELQLLNIPKRSIYKRDYGNAQTEILARDLLGKDGSPFNLNFKMAKYIKSKPYQDIIKRAEKITKERGKPKTILGFEVNDPKNLTAKSPFGQVADLVVAPAQRSQLLIKVARGYVADARAWAMSSEAKDDVKAGAPYTVIELKGYKSLSATVNSAANEYYRQENEFVYDKNKNPIEPKNIYLDREYFTIKGPLTDESWRNKKNVLVEGLEYAKAIQKKDFGK